MAARRSGLGTEEAVSQSFAAMVVALSGDEVDLVENGKRPLDGYRDLVVDRPS